MSNVQCPICDNPNRKPPSRPVICPLCGKVVEPKMGYRLKPEQLPCKSARHDFDSVPVPFGSGNCSMPCFECVYDGDTEIPDDLVCKEDKTCPAYEPVPTFICEKHDEEYWDWCGQCERDAMGYPE